MARQTTGRNCFVKECGDKSDKLKSIVRLNLSEKQLQHVLGDHKSCPQIKSITFSFLHVAAARLFKSIMCLNKLIASTGCVRRLRLESVDNLNGFRSSYRRRTIPVHENYLSPPFSWVINDPILSRYDDLKSVSSNIMWIFHSQLPGARLLHNFHPYKWPKLESNQRFQ